MKGEAEKWLTGDREVQVAGGEAGDANQVFVKTPLKGRPGHPALLTLNSNKPPYEIPSSQTSSVYAGLEDPDFVRPQPEHTREIPPSETRVNSDDSKIGYFVRRFVSKGDAESE